MKTTQGVQVCIILITKILDWNWESKRKMVRSCGMWNWSEDEVIHLKYDVLVLKNLQMELYVFLVFCFFLTNDIIFFISTAWSVTFVHFPSKYFQEAELFEMLHNFSFLKHIITFMNFEQILSNIYMPCLFTTNLYSCSECPDISWCGSKFIK